MARDGDQSWFESRIDVWRNACFAAYPLPLSEIDLVSVGNLWVGNKDGHPFVPRRILMERRIRPFAGVVVVVSARRGRRGRGGVRECANNL